VTVDSIRRYPTVVLRSGWAATGPLALVFTDIVGSTALGNQVGDERVDEVSEDHFAQGERLIERYHGRLLKTIGDSLMVVFRSVDVALDFSRRFLRSPGNPNIEIRAGIHVGSVSVKESDVFGTNVALAARVAGAFKGAEIWLSAEAMCDFNYYRPERFNHLKWTPHRIKPNGFSDTTFWAMSELREADEVKRSAESRNRLLLELPQATTVETRGKVKRRGSTKLPKP
jgi:hypothetical protein